jgi:hypothetical protein
MLPVFYVQIVWSALSGLSLNRMIVVSTKRSPSWIVRSNSAAPWIHPLNVSNRATEQYDDYGRK